MERPYFSVVISSYHRAAIVSRCIRSALASEFEDYEIVVVDDGSSDGTTDTLAADFDDPRLRVIALDRNRGMSEARRVGTEAATGVWVVVLDSDWELEPFSLTRLRAIIASTPEEVRVLWTRMRWDDGRIEPSVVPSGVVRYEGKLEWWDTPAAGDCMRCVRREVFERTPYHADRRGAMDTLYELDLARNELAIYSEEVLCLQHADAPNSWLRSSDSKALVPRLKADAPDMLWAFETSLTRHGSAVSEHAPSLLILLIRTAAVQAFILGQRRRGARHAVSALRRAPTDVSLWLALMAGLAGPTTMLRAVVLDRRRAARRRDRGVETPPT